MDNHGGDCNWEGWPSWQSYAINMHNKAVNAPYQTNNASASADGLIGGFLPAVAFYLPMLDNGTSVNRYWTYVAVPVADMKGSREQSVWFRYQQLECAGPNKAPPCKLVGWPLYWDSYWYARFPGANATDTQAQTLSSGPVNASSPGGFYANLIANKKWWDNELTNEGMMHVDLPSPKSTNGSWLAAQAKHAIVRSMITRQNTWEPRYGIIVPV